MLKTQKTVNISQINYLYVDHSFWLTEYFTFSSHILFAFSVNHLGVTHQNNHVSRSHRNTRGLVSHRLSVQRRFFKSLDWWRGWLNTNRSFAGWELSQSAVLTRDGAARETWKRSSRKLTFSHSDRSYSRDKGGHLSGCTFSPLNSRRDFYSEVDISLSKLKL